MQKTFRRALLGLAVLGMLCTLISPVQPVSAAARTYPDLKNHWAAGDINRWNSLGLVGGYPNGTFGPSRLMTKAEFITYVNRAFGYTKTTAINFTDVKSTNWFAGDVAKAIAMGYTQRNANGTFTPNQPISRLEAARILYKVLRLEPVSQDFLAQFTDIGSLSAADKPMVNAIVAGHYFGGYPDKTLRISSTISRAEMIVVLARGAGEIMNVATTFGPATGTQTITGNATINMTGITLQNTTINGDLYITEGVGEGDFYLKNVNVLGRTIVAGGGSHSGHVEGDSQLAHLIITYPDGSTHVVFADTASATDVEFRSAGDLDTTASTSETRPNVTLGNQIPAGSTVTVVGDFGAITTNAPGVTVQLGEGSSAESVTSTESATGSTMSIQGNVTGSVTNNAPDSTTSIGSTGSANNVTTSETATGSQTNVQGQVGTLENQAPNSSTDVAPTGTVTNVTNTATATGSTTTVQGNVTNLTQNAPQSTTTVSAGAAVATLTAGSTATGTSVAVQGTVTELQTSVPITVEVSAGGSLETVQMQEGAGGSAITTGEGVTPPTVTAPPDVIWDNNGDNQTGGTPPPPPPPPPVDPGTPDPTSVDIRSISLEHDGVLLPMDADGSNYSLDLSAQLEDMKFTGVHIVTEPSSSTTLHVTGAYVLNKSFPDVDKSYILHGDTLTVPDLMSLVDDLDDDDLSTLVEIVTAHFGDTDISLANLRALLDPVITLTGELTQQVNGHTITSGPLTITIIL